MYKVKVEQKVLHKGRNSSDADYTTSEEITGIAETFESLSEILGVITEVFPDTSITISNINKED